MLGGGARWLLIGNSRWHWAEDRAGGRHYWSEPPRGQLAAAPQRWVAVGPRPQGLDAAGELHLAEVPLRDLPPWLGIDRALAGYQAWSRTGSAVLVADAGTALSLTWVDGTGRFCGGRLMAGAALQLQALHRGTAALPAVTALEHVGLAVDTPIWPRSTEAAMASGVLQGLAGALDRAALQLRAREPQLQLWLTGGDAEALQCLLQGDGTASTAAGGWQLSPGLCLDGLAAVAALSSERGR